MHQVCKFLTQQDIRDAFAKQEFRKQKQKERVIVESSSDDEAAPAPKPSKITVDPKDFFKKSSKTAKKQQPLVSKQIDENTILPMKRKNEDINEGSKKVSKSPNPKKDKSPKKLLKTAADTADVQPSDAPPKKFNFFQYQAQKASHQITVSRKMPTGAPNCLAGQAFVFTGDLNSMTREQATDLIKSLGGRVVTAPSRKTTFVVVGENPGPSKIKKVQDLGISTLNEDQFYDYINSFGDNDTENASNLITYQETVDASPRETQMAIPKKSEEKDIKMTLPSKKISSDEVIELPKVKGKSKLESGNINAELWTEKYKPKTIHDIIGNKGMVERLSKWLDNWSKSYKANFPKGDSQFRAALISGPPGIGKTTSAHLVAKLLNFEILEFNASDTRSKKSLQSMVAETTTTKSVMELFQKSKPRHKVLIMDEVDGMSAGDRGGNAELINIIKKTGIPIICICNDRSSPKVRSLANHCLDLRFRRPTAQQIELRISKIAEMEGLKVGANAISELAASTSADIRQLLNILSTYSIGAEVLSYTDSKQLGQDTLKNVTLSPFDVIGKLLGQSSFRNSSFEQKVDYYFQDYSLMPLMVAENYINVTPSLSSGSGLTGKALNAENLKLTFEAAESISMGDLLDTAQRSENSWSLLPLHAVISTVRPCFFTHGAMQGRFSFPSWLGQYSKSAKGARLLREIQQHLRLKVSADKQQIRLAYLPVLAEKITKPLHSVDVRITNKGIGSVIEFMDTYYLNREDWDSVIELGYNHLITDIPAKVKSGFTRQYNKGTHPSPFDNSTKSKTKITAAIPDSEDILLEDEVEVEEEEEVQDLSIQAVVPKKVSAKKKSKK